MAIARNPLAEAYRSAEGIPQEGAIPVGAPGAPGAGGIGDLLLALRGGQVSAERLLQLLALLAGAGQAPGGGQQQGGSPIEAAMSGQYGG